MFAEMSRQLLNTNDGYVPTIADMTSWDIVALVFMSCCLVLASAAGIGGGPMFVPVLAVFMDIPLKKALPLSNIIIAGGAIANNFYGLLRRHPTAERPVIDFDISIVMVPMVIGGAVVGVFLSIVLPDFVIGILMVLVLGFYGFNTTKKGLAARAKHLAKSKANATQGHTSGEVERTAKPSSLKAAEEARSANERKETTPKEDAPRDSLQFSYANIPLPKLVFLFACLAGLVILAFTGKQLSCPGWRYWLIFWAEFPWAVSFSFAAAVYLLRLHKLKVENGYEFIPGEVEFTTKGATNFALRCSIVGVMAGLFGIGGGVFVGPMMIQMKVVPEVAAATTAVLVFFASMAAVVKFIAIGKIALNTFTLMLFLLGFGITFVAQKFIMRYVRKSGKSYIIVLMIGTSIALGAALMVYLAIALTIHFARFGNTVNYCH